jgi:phosphate transport system substrate-binding protein
MKAVPIQWEKNKVKEPVMPTLENVLAGTYNPLSRPLFIYVNRKSLDRPEVKEFVEFYLKNAGALTREVKYLPLPDKAYEMGLQRFNERKTGSGFGGVPEIGLPIEEILNRPPK